MHEMFKKSFDFKEITVMGLQLISTQHRGINLMEKWYNPSHFKNIRKITQGYRRIKLFGYYKIFSRDNWF